MGYTPVFESVFSGSLCGQYPDTAAWLFLLAMADKNGEIDKTPHYIATVTGMPLETLTGCIERFLQPDPRSRTKTNEGRRLELLASDRDWGWRIINFHLYREKARLQAKSAAEVESGRNAERLRDRRRPPGTAADPLSDADSDSNLLKKPANAAEKREEGKRIWPRVVAAISNEDLRKSLSADANEAVRLIGGYSALGSKARDLRGQSEQAFLNTYADLFRA